MISGIGVDIVKIARFEGKAENSKFMARIFTTREQDYLANKSIQSMAGLFAAKEAVAKALGTGFRGFSPCDIEITHDELGKPQVVLHNAANETIKNTTKKAVKTAQILLSISHNETDAVAFAVVE